MRISIVPPDSSGESGLTKTDDGPARLGRKGDINQNQGVDATEYPYIDVHINVDLNDEVAALSKEHFKITEEGEPKSIESFDFRSSSLDLVFVFDDTGSMVGEIAGAKRGVTKLTDAVAERGIDARYGLVSFKDDVEVDQSMTADSTELKAAIDALEAGGGGDRPEANFDAIERALDLRLRNDATTVFVNITDANSHFRGDGSGYSDYVIGEVASDLENASVSFVSVSPDDSGRSSLDDDWQDRSLRLLADMVGGLWTDIDDEDFDWVLDRIIALLIGTYVIRIHTCTPPGERREFSVIFDHPKYGSDQDIGSFVIPESETLPPECADKEEKVLVETGGEEKEPEPPAPSDNPKPLAAEVDQEIVEPGDVITVTVRDPDGRVEDAVVEAYDQQIRTSDSGTAKIRIEKTGEVDLQIFTSGMSHEPTSRSVEVVSDTEPGIADRTLGVDRSPTKSHRDDEPIPVILEPSPSSPSPGQQITLTVRDNTGSRADGVTIEASTGETATTDSRGVCRFTFEEPNIIELTVQDDAYEPETLELTVDN